MLGLLLLLLTPPPATAQGEARAVLEELVAADTSNPPGNEARAAEIGARRLKAAGIPFELTEFAPGRKNLVARLKGSGEEGPLLLLAHTDVPGADAQAWTRPPHRLAAEGGWLFGRGVYDMLGMAAIELEVFLALAREKVPLRRDVILAWTGDEQQDGSGIRYLLENRRDSVAAALAINEGAGVVLGEDGKPRLAEVQMAEKTYQDFEIVALGPGGHAAVPLPDNAVYRLARGLERLSRHRFPARVLEVARAYLEARAPLEEPELAVAMRAVAGVKGDIPIKALKRLESNPTLSANLRTTCVATLLEAGTRINTLPERAKAGLNCRLLPGDTVAATQRELERVLGDPALVVRPIGTSRSSGPSPAAGEGPDAIRRAIEATWPGLPVVPVMSRSASDSVFLREAAIPTYGIHPIGVTEADARRAHASDERISEASFDKGREFFSRLVRELAVRP